MDTFRLLVCISLMAVSSRCAIFTTEQEQQITDFVQRLMTCKDNPGLTLSVVKGSETWTKGFGMADLDTDRPVQEDTMFMICSLGKAFTMTLLGNLLDGTSYTWSTKLSDIDGVNVKFINDSLTREVTLADLLAHKTGLSDMVDFGFIAGYPEGTTIEGLSSRVKYNPAQYDHRDPTFLYNNFMYMVLGHVIEVLGKDTWSNLMTSRILEPLGMTTTKLMSRADDVLVGNVAKPYMMPGDVLVDATAGLYKVTPLEPAGGILSSAVDMAKWIRFNLNQGATSDGRQLVNKELFDEAFKKHQDLGLFGDMLSVKKPEFPVDAIFNGYGYGWFTSTYRGYNRISHSGGYFAYVSLLWLFPEQDFGLFVNVNGPAKPGSSDVYMTLYYIADILLGVEPWLNHSTACTYPAPWRSPDDLSMFEMPHTSVYTKENLGDYTGAYGSPILPDITITLSEDEQRLRLLWNRVKGFLIPDSDRDGFKFFQLNITEPWEYMMEKKMYGGLVTILYPVQFIRDSSDVVQSFNIRLGDKAIMPFLKDACFVCMVNEELADDPLQQAEEPTNGDRLLRPSLSVLLFIAVCFMLH